MACNPPIWSGSDSPESALGVDVDLPEVVTETEAWTMLLNPPDTAKKATRDHQVKNGRTEDHTMKLALTLTDNYTKNGNNFLQTHNLYYVLYPAKMTRELSMIHGLTGRDPSPFPSRHHHT